MRLITASKISSIPFPVFALTINASSGTIPKVFSISLSTSSGREFGRSILLMTGMIARLCSMAR